MRINLLYFAMFSLILNSCTHNYTPKPRAFFKVNLPEKQYHYIDIDCNFFFEKPIYSFLDHLDENCFFNLKFPDQNGVLYITYLPVKNNLSEHIEQSRSFAYKHNIVADAISELVYINEKHKVYGLLYDYEGVTATSTQFYLTDSVNHFFRASLYFDTEINDSLLPINNFIKADVKHLIESFRWKNQ
tara:strand:- start:115 stop:675 length:561 start_codon:yes stop_codon:yes gene_type:complete